MAKSNILGNVLRGVGKGWIRHQDERKKKRTEQEKYERDNKRSLEKEQRQTERQITGEKRRRTARKEDEQANYELGQDRQATDRNAILERVIGKLGPDGKYSGGTKSDMANKDPNTVAQYKSQIAGDPQAQVPQRPQNPMVEQKILAGDFQGALLAARGNALDTKAVVDSFNMYNKRHPVARASSVSGAGGQAGANQPTYDRQAIRYLSDDIDDLYRQRKNLRVDKDELGEDAPTKAQTAKRKRIDNEIATSETRLRQLRRGNSAAVAKPANREAAMQEIKNLFSDFAPTRKKKVLDSVSPQPPSVASNTAQIPPIDASIGGGVSETWQEPTASDTAQIGSSQLAPDPQQAAFTIMSGTIADQMGRKLTDDEMGFISQGIFDGEFEKRGIKINLNNGTFTRARGGNELPLKDLIESAAGQFSFENLLQKGSDAKDWLSNAVGSIPRSIGSAGRKMGLLTQKGEDALK